MPDPPEQGWQCLCDTCACVSQCCDLGFHASLARTFRTYLSAEYNLETSRHEGLDIIENAVDNLDARSDKHTIMDMCNQVFCPPLKFEFQPHMGDEVLCLLPGAVGLPRSLAWAGSLLFSAIAIMLFLPFLFCLHMLLFTFPFLMRHLAH